MNTLLGAEGGGYMGDVRIGVNTKGASWDLELNRAQRVHGDLPLTVCHRLVASLQKAYH